MHYTPKKKKNDNYKENKWVFKCFLNNATEVQERMLKGRLFQIVGPEKNIFCWPFFELMRGICRRRGSESRFYVCLLFWFVSCIKFSKEYILYCLLSKMGQLSYKHYVSFQVAAYSVRFMPLSNMFWMYILWDISDCYMQNKINGIK